MSNLIVLCHHCLSWIEPISDSCPECGMEADLRQPDPDLGSLAKSMGELVSVAGPVRIDRRNLPSFGHLVVTTGGLLFLPRLHRRLNGALEPLTSKRTPGWWPFHGEQSSARFLAWLRRPFTETGANPNQAVAASDKNTEPLVDQLMESPGAFFIARETIRSLITRRRSIHLNRAPIRSVIMIDETDNGSLISTLNSLHEQAAGRQTT